MGTDDSNKPKEIGHDELKVFAETMAAGGPAFPFTLKQHNGAEFVYAGMTLRDYFAEGAMRSLLSNGYMMQQLNDEIEKARIPGERRAHAINRVVSKRAYMLADAMLVARAVENP
jgi:hypothetical protein